LSMVKARVCNLKSVLLPAPSGGTPRRGGGQIQGQPVPKFNIKLLDRQAPVLQGAGPFPLDVLGGQVHQFEQAHGLLPLVPLVQGTALDNTAPGETQKPRLESIQELHQILSQSPFSSLPGILGEQGNQVHINTSLALKGDF